MGLESPASGQILGAEPNTVPVRSQLRDMLHVHAILDTDIDGAEI